MTYGIFVSTYGEYNNGSLKGRWIDISNMTYKEYTEALQNLINTLDLAGDEPMIQDNDGVPEFYYSEYGIDPEFFEVLENYDEFDRDVIFAYKSELGNDSPDYILDHFAGRYESPEDMVCEYIDAGTYGDIPENLSGYLDIGKMARDLMMDYCSAGDYYFCY